MNVKDNLDMNRELIVEFTEEEYTKVSGEADAVGLSVEDYLLARLEGKNSRFLIEERILRLFEELQQHIDPDSEDYELLKKQISEFRKEMDSETNES